MRVRLRNKRPTLHLTLRAKANIKPAQTGERTKQGQAAACVSERERESERWTDIGLGRSQVCISPGFPSKKLNSNVAIRRC